MRKLALGIAVFTAIGMPTFAQHYDPDLGSRKYRPWLGGATIRAGDLAYIDQRWPMAGSTWTARPRSTCAHCIRFPD